MPDIDDILAWENGEMDREREREFFQGLVTTGAAWKLQGMYGRRAAQLLERGDIHK